jgi:hypothetical protein
MHFVKNSTFVSPVICPTMEVHVSAEELWADMLLDRELFCGSDMWKMFVTSHREKYHRQILNETIHLYGQNYVQILRN